jgi:uncharacterized membrane protein YfcA
MPDVLAPLSLFLVALIGLIAGLGGGMLGIGGSIVIIPGLTLVFGYDQHLYQAAAMIANVAVSVPAAMRHRAAGAMHAPTLKWMAPAAVVSVLLGVWLSNLFAGPAASLWLSRLLAAFLVYVIAVNVRRLLGGRRETRHAAETLALPRVRRLSVGSAMGGIAGLLGIGGGALAVPMQQIVLKLPLKNAIANSSAIICISATIGAIYKNASLGQHSHAPLDGVLLAALVVPTAWLGGGLGARLTHALPMRYVRVAFVALLVVAAWKMAALDLPGGGLG